MWTQFRRRDRYDGFVWPESASSQPFWGFCVTRVSIVATVSAVLSWYCQPKIQSNRCRDISHMPWCERKWNKHANQSIQIIHRTGVGAYRIRPHVGENEMMTANTSSSFDMQFPRHGGRMRYAPTHVRLFHGWHGGWTGWFHMMLPNMTSSFNMLFPCHVGRMRFAPTVFGWKLGRHDGQTGCCGAIFMMITRWAND